MSPVDEHSGIESAFEEDSSEYKYQLLELQTLWCQTIDQTSSKGLRAGYCDVGTDKRKEGNLVDYIELTRVMEGGGLFEEWATQLLEVFKKICVSTFGEQPALPSEYRQMKYTVLKKINYKLLPITKERKAYPVEMFGVLASRMQDMHFCFVDPLLVVAEKLTTPDKCKLIICSYVKQHV